MGWLDNILIVFLLSVLLCLSFVRALLPSESSPRFTHDVIEWRLVYCTSFCESTIASRVCLFVLVACDQIRELAVQFKTAALQRQNEDSTLEQVKLLDIRLVCFSSHSFSPRVYGCRQTASTSFESHVLRSCYPGLG